jgi:hypothetical protein
MAMAQVLDPLPSKQKTLSSVSNNEKLFTQLKKEKEEKLITLGTKLCRPHKFIWNDFDSRYLPNEESKK